MFDYKVTYFVMLHIIIHRIQFIVYNVLVPNEVWIASKEFDGMCLCG